MLILGGEAAFFNIARRSGRSTLKRSIARFNMMQCSIAGSLPNCIMKFQTGLRAEPCFTSESPLSEKRSNNH